MVVHNFNDNYGISDDDLHLTIIKQKLSFATEFTWISKNTVAQ